MNYINKNKINVKYEDIEKMAESGLSLDDTIDGLDKDVKGCDKKIKGCNKKINNYSVALDNIRSELEPEKTIPTTPPGPENKLKWYQFGKKFRNWMEQRKQSKLPPPAPTPTKRPDTIRDALKYDIVKELVGYDDKTTGEHVFGTMEQQQLRDAKKEGKSKEDDEAR